MVNPDMDDYTKTLNHQKKTTYWRPKYKPSGCPVSMFSLPGGLFIPLPPPCKLSHWPAHSTDVIMRRWGPPASKFQIWDYQNKDRLSVFRLPILPQKFKQGHTKPSTGPMQPTLDIAVIKQHTNSDDNKNKLRAIAFCSPLDKFGVNAIGADDVVISEIAQIYHAVKHNLSCNSPDCSLELNSKLCARMKEMFGSKKELQKELFKE